MTGPLAPLFAQVRKALEEYWGKHEPTDSELGGNALRALSSIERHVQDMDDSATEANDLRHRLRSSEALLGVKARKLHAVESLLAELEESVSEALGSMAFYFGPNARTAVSRESSARFLRIKAARDAARAALPASGTQTAANAGRNRVAREKGTESRNLDGTNTWTPHDDPRGIGR